MQRLLITANVCTKSTPTPLTRILTATTLPQFAISNSKHIDNRVGSTCTNIVRRLPMAAPQRSSTLPHIATSSSSLATPGTPRRDRSRPAGMSSAAYANIKLFSGMSFTLISQEGGCMRTQNVYGP